MRILAVDTSTRFLCLGVSDGDKAYEYRLEAATLLSSLLVPSIKRVLGAAGLRPRDIDYFACGLGPGSFTGVRVGLAAIKALAWSLDKPVVGVSTLDILARNAPAGQGISVPTIDAKRGLVYSCIYKINNGSYKKVAPYLLLSPEELIRKIKSSVNKKGESGISLLGDGLNICRQAVSFGLPDAAILDKDYWYPEVHNMLDCVQGNIRSKNNIDTPFGIKPVYLYPKECQIRKHK